MPSKNVLLTALARTAYDALRKWIEQRTGCPEQAADIAQESFARLAAIDNLASIGDPRALYTCAQHLTIDQFRRQNQLKVDTEIAFDDLPCPAPGPEECLALERRCGRLLEVRVSGNFRSDDIETLVQALPKVLPIDIAPQTPNTLRITRRLRS